MLFSLHDLLAWNTMAHSVSAGGTCGWPGALLMQLYDCAGRRKYLTPGDYLRDDIYELRASHQGIHYRMLYFFHGTAAIIVSHGLIKER
jgi:hypothetical protein